MRWQRRTRGRKLGQDSSVRRSLQRKRGRPGVEMSLDARDDSVEISPRHERVDQLIASPSATSASESPR